ncbi:MAG: RNA-binding S4 domain-containing protein [Thermoleophilia bacterium]|nr:RNA-binding S4 domain-containing protein [Thermoleophilia bacterium]
MSVSGGPSLAGKTPQRVTVRLPITLGQFVKAAGPVGTGGEAKQVIAAGLVKVNGTVDERRGHKLTAGDVVEIRGVAKEVAVAEVPPPRG